MPQKTLKKNLGLSVLKAKGFEDLLYITIK